MYCLYEKTFFTPTLGKIVLSTSLLTPIVLVTIADNTLVNAGLPPTTTLNYSCLLSVLWGAADK